MPEEVLFESERAESRHAIAEYLRQVAENLDAGEPIVLRSGEQELSVSPPDRLEFEVKAEREGRPGEPGEISLEFELEWDESAGDSDRLEID